MASKKTQEVLIDGKIYRLSGYESESYLQSVASYLNRRIEELKKLDSYRKLSGEQRALLLELNLADDYFKARETIDRLKEDEQQREKEIYELKHQLAAARLASSHAQASSQQTDAASAAPSAGKAAQTVSGHTSADRNTQPGVGHSSGSRNQAAGRQQGRKNS